MTFSALASKTAVYSGRPSVFFAHVALMVIWACFGPFTGYSDAWQLVLNTATSVITTLMVLLIQGQQTRDSSAVQAKLDELIHAVEGARNSLIGVEQRHDAEIEQIRRPPSEEP